MDKYIFIEGLKKWDIPCNEEKIKKYEEFSSLLKEGNKKINLTAITDDEGISTKHFLDSLSPLICAQLKEGAKVLDIGTGAGFPGIPLKIMREDLDITLLDSLKKRIVFLGEVKEKLGFDKLELLHERAEILGKNSAYREKYDYVFSRAVASLKILSEYALPFLNIGGTFFALKASKIDEEINDAKAMIGSVGGKIEDIKEITIPFTDIKRKIVEIKKLKKTPSEFPRSNKKIKG